MKLSSNNGIFSFLKSHILKKKILCGPPCSCAYICRCHHINMLAVRCAFQHRNLRSVFDLVFVRNENIAKLSKHTHMHGYSKKRMNLLMYLRPLDWVKCKVRYASQNKERKLKFFGAFHAPTHIHHTRTYNKCLERIAHIHRNMRIYCTFRFTPSFLTGFA